MENIWEKKVRRIELLLRLKSFPVALKLLEERSMLSKIPYLRRPESRKTLCQLITLVRNFDWTVGADKEDFLFPTCPSIIGLSDIPETHRDGTFRNIIWTAKKDDGKKFENSVPRIEAGYFEAVALAPLVYNPFEPDMVLIYGNPAQIILMINAIQHEKYEVMEFSCVGESSCSDAIVRCFKEKKPKVAIPCYGERRYGHAQDDDMVIALPLNYIDKMLNGLEALYRKGVRYPISYAGAEGDIMGNFPQSYLNLDSVIEKLKGDGKRTVIGITGGIASGKSTVSELLEKKGAPLIDFDILARSVVEKGKPALKKIKEYFGTQVLAEDGSLDRKRLSKIVFNDFEKRKKLESFTHPAIFDEFFTKVDELSKGREYPVIQAGIPLLMELNLQYMFEKVIVVYIPKEEQIKRLAKRDSINENDAANILKSQLPIEDKKRYADFVVDNTGDLNDLENRVDELWEYLKEYKKKKNNEYQ